MDTRSLADAVRELALLADRDAAQGEAGGRLAPDVLASLRRGVLKAMLPEASGGLGLNVVGLADLLMRVSRGCGSTGLCTAWYVGRLWMAALFPAPALAAVLASDEFPLVTDALAANGRLQPQPDGSFLLSGEWPFATGVVDAGWLIATAELPIEGGRTRSVSCLVPREGFEVVPGWTAMGMKATGTDGVRINQWRVTAEFTADFNALLDGSAGAGGPVSRYPFDALAFIAMAAVAVGMAERLYEEARKQLAPPAGRPPSSASERHLDIGRDFAQLRMARASVMRMAEDLHLMARGDAPVSLMARQGMRVTASEIIGQCVQLSVALAGDCGTRAMLAESPVQRFVRDIIVLSSHIFVRSDLARAGFRRQLLG